MRLIRLLRKDLASEMSTWIDRELMSVEQARAICRLYGVDYDETRARSGGYRVLTGLGFLFIGLSLITVIGANWEAIPRGVRLAGLIALTAGAHAFALRHFLSAGGSRGTGLFMLGNLFYGAAIILIAQTYHLGEPTSERFFVSVALFILAYSASHWLHSARDSRAKDYGVVLALWTLRFALLGLFVLSFERPWLELIESDWSSQPTVWTSVAILMAVALGLGSRTGTPRPLLAVCALTASAMVAVVHTESVGAAIWFQVLDNVALIAAGTWLVVRGALGGISHYFFMGVVVILLTAFIRYLDLIGDYVGGALLFLVLAVLLLGSARFWKHRQDAGKEA